MSTNFKKEFGDRVRFADILMAVETAAATERVLRYCSHHLTDLSHVVLDTEGLTVYLRGESRRRYYQGKHFCELRLGGGMGVDATVAGVIAMLGLESYETALVAIRLSSDDLDELTFYASDV